MAVRPIIQYPNKVLNKVCAPVTIFDQNLKALVRDLKDTLEASKIPGVGLSAPQIGVSQRVFVVRRFYKAESGREEYEEFTVINPEIIKHSKKKVKSLEACLSMKDVFGFVERFNQVTIRYVDFKNVSKELGGGGLFSFAIQHEMDHLDGVLFTSKVLNSKTYTEKQIEEMY